MATSFNSRRSLGARRPVYGRRCHELSARHAGGGAHGGGLEIGEVLSPAAEAPVHGEADGSILRGLTIEDQLLEARLERNRQEAYQACTGWLAERKLAATLVDVEQLFDGRRLFFYFLGEPPAEIEALTEQLAEVYDAAAQISRFAATLTEGCGPGCGTSEATGGGCGSCATGCAVAGACSTRKH